jgi:hypothetical protein
MKCGRLDGATSEHRPTKTRSDCAFALVLLAFFNRIGIEKALPRGAAKVKLASGTPSGGMGRTLSTCQGAA